MDHLSDKITRRSWKRIPELPQGSIRTRSSGVPVFLQTGMSSTSMTILPFVDQETVVDANSANSGILPVDQ
jgi:hypothetical protein